MRTIKFFIPVFIFAVLLPGVLCAQNLEVISYAPVKRGDYQHISVHSNAALATGVNSAVIVNNFIARSSRLHLDGREGVRFDGNILVRNNFFARRFLVNNNPVDITTQTPAIHVDGFLYVDSFAGSVMPARLSDVTSPANPTRYIAAKDISLGGRSITLSRSGSNSQVIVVDQIPLQAPPSGCNVGWIPNVTAADTSVPPVSSTYTIFGCT